MVGLKELTQQAIQTPKISQQRIQPNKSTQQMIRLKELIQQIILVHTHTTTSPPDSVLKMRAAEVTMLEDPHI